jgi:hypothetical protein
MFNLRKIVENLFKGFMVSRIIKSGVSEQTTHYNNQTGTQIERINVNHNLIHDYDKEVMDDQQIKTKINEPYIAKIELPSRSMLYGNTPKSNSTFDEYINLLTSLGFDTSHELMQQALSKINDEIILVKNDGILPGADGFSPNNTPRKPHHIPRMRGRGTDINIDLPQNIQGLGNIPKAPKARSFREVDTGLNGRRSNHGDQCPAPEFDMEKEYIMFMEDMSQKGMEVECDQERFNELSVNRETGSIDEKSIFEATDINTGQRIFVDHKGMIDFQSLADQGKDISRFPNHMTVAYRMGQSIPSQKERFVGLPQGPKSANDILHLVNFDKIRNSLEKPYLVGAVLNGAEDSGCRDNIAFINFE